MVRVILVDYLAYNISGFWGDCAPDPHWKFALEPRWETLIQTLFCFFLPLSRFLATLLSVNMQCVVEIKAKKWMDWRIDRRRRVTI